LSPSRTLISKGWFSVASCDAPKDVENEGVGFALEKKYYLRECLVSLDFKWNDSDSMVERVKVTRGISENVKAAIVSGEFPFFGGGTSNQRNAYLFYFGDDCENRELMMKSMLERYLLPNITSFPKYSISIDSISLVNYGSLPSGLWLDEE